MLDRKVYIISDNFIFGVDRQTKCLNDDVNGNFRKPQAKRKLF